MLVIINLCMNKKTYGIITLLPEGALFFGLKVRWFLEDNRFV